MPEIVPPKDTPAERGHRAVERESTATGAGQAIDREIGQHVGDTKGNREFLQAASADLQKNGILPEMAVDFGKKHFKEMDTDKDGYASEAEIRRALQKGQDHYTPAERLAGNYLADRVADPKSGLTYWKGLTTEALLDQYGKDTATKYSEYNNGQAAVAAFGGSKDFAALDTDKSGTISAAEMQEKLTYNERRLSEDDVSQKTKDKFEKENKALKYMLEHQGEMNNGSGLWGSDLTLASIKKYAEDHKNPGVTEGTYGVNSDMVRPTAEVEAKLAEVKAIADAKAATAAAEAKAKADEAEAKAKAEAELKKIEAEKKQPKDEPADSEDEVKRKEREAEEAEVPEAEVPEAEVPEAEVSESQFPDLPLLERFRVKPTDLTLEPPVCKPGDPSCHVGPTKEGPAPQDRPKSETPEQPVPGKPIPEGKDDRQKPQEKEDKQEQPESKQPEKHEKPLTAMEKLAAKAGAATLETAGGAYASGLKDGKGVAVMIVGESVPGSKELLEKLPELMRQNPELNFVVIDRDKVNSSADPAMAPWKSWVNARQAEYNHAFTSVQSLKADAKGNAIPDKVTSTYWGTDNIETRMKDQAHYAADGTKRNSGAPPSETTRPVNVPDAPSPDQQTKKVERNTNDKPNDKPNERPRDVTHDRPKEVRYVTSQTELDAQVKENAALGLPTIIDVTRSSGCGNCDSQNPVMDRLAREFPGQIIKVNADTALGMRHSQPGSVLPNIIVKPVNGQGRRFQGFQNESVLRQVLGASN